ncbi:MAG: hypothetical protein KAS72_04170 [Phycisphaerales bacterium]|nr:hypothetical protein [Phycisphaerales bacterium]
MKGPSNMKRSYTIVFVISVVLLPLLPLLAMLPIINSINPMQIGFITDITIANRTEETIKVTPIGATGREAKRQPLPIYATRAPATCSRQLGGFIVEPGEATVILYDWDDVNFSEIVVETESGDLFQLMVDPTPEKNQYHAPTVKSFVISDLGALSPISAEVLPAYEEAKDEFSLWRSYYSLMWPILVLAAVPWSVFIFLLVRRRTWQGRPHGDETAPEARAAIRAHATNHAGS